MTTFAFAESRGDDSFSPALLKDTHEKIVYMTFDDGPSSGTEAVINILKEEGVDATMFFIGRNVASHERLFQKAINMPNLLIANHTYTHANGKYAKFYSDPIGVLADIDRAQDTIGGAKYLRLAGRNVWRLPEVSRNDTALSRNRVRIEKEAYNLLEVGGYQIYGWDIEWEFSHKTGYALWGAESMYDKLERRYESGKLRKDGKVVLLTHDRMFRNRLGKRRLREFVRLMKLNGWSFDTISTYSDTTPDVIVRNSAKTKEKLVRIAKKMLKAPSTKKKKMKRRDPLKIFNIVKDDKIKMYLIG
jgi:peptidoglycan/xylan/chitin deacetylase (PgdA/CDA1 family)